MRMLLITSLLVGASPVLAGHANPWATEDDVIREQYHDVNQARSIDTPGQDEMKGRMVQKARGKLDPSVGKQAAGQGGGKGRRK